MNMTVFANVMLLTAATALSPILGKADVVGPDAGMLLAHESPRLERCEARLARTARSLGKSKRDVADYKQKLDRASLAMRQLRAGASTGGNCGASANLRAVAKATAGQNACGNGNSCAQVIPFNVPNPTDNLGISWTNGMLLVQGNMIHALAPNQPISALEAEEAKVCKSGQVFCKVAFRQLVLQELVN